MPFIPVPNTVEARMEFVLGDTEQMVNVLHYLIPEGVEFDFGGALNLSNGLRDAWVENLAPMTSDTVTLSAISVKSIEAVENPSILITQGVEGEDVAQALPYPTSLCATLYTNNGTRGGRGRVFFGGFTEVHNEGGDLATVALQVAVQAFLADISDIPNTATDPDTSFVLGVTSRAAHVGGDPTAALIPAVTRPLAAVRVNRRWDVQRRRSNKIRL